MFSACKLFTYFIITLCTLHIYDCLANISANDYQYNIAVYVRMIGSLYEAHYASSMDECAIICAQTPECASAQLGLDQCPFFRSQDVDYAQFERNASYVYIFRCHRYRDSCYWPNQSYVSWTNASKHCFIQGAHLADVSNADENTFILSLMLSRSWLDGTDAGSES